jgi:hypothetical protein
MQRYYPIIFLLVYLFSCTESPFQKKEQRLFQELNAEETGVFFENKLKEDLNHNIIKYLYFYNGGGVGIGDLNNDGLPDLFFTSNMSENRLYINKGNWKFEDVSIEAGITGRGSWSTGVSIADINNDGWLDIYVCNVSGHLDFKGRNELFLNNGDGTFDESATKYGLDFSGYSTQAAFFDYDLDGDLDCYLLNHSIHTIRSYGKSEIRNERDANAGDILFENKQGYFVDVSEKAGIFGGSVGYGLAVGISDINNDSWPDIYVSNDFHENDYLYINQQNGTFIESIQSATGHTSRFSMGNDLADFNNDFQTDILSLDMLPPDEEILKVSGAEDPFDIYQLKVDFGYHHQTSRNNLQLNRYGCHFSEIGLLAGIEATDWSWGGVFGDFDRDGLKDIYITNGIKHRPNNMDYISFISNDIIQKGLQNNIDSIYVKVLSKMPSGISKNVAFKNKGDLTFRNVSEDWGLNKLGISHGVAYGDLDLDGDLDIVVNNLNEGATLYENRTEKGHYLKIYISNMGDSSNVFGTKAYLYQGKLKQYQELYTIRGWQSSMEPVLFFGSNDRKADSLLIQFPNRKKIKFVNLNLDTTININANDARRQEESKLEEKCLFRKVVGKNSINYANRENKYVDFNFEALIPHMITTDGPRIDTADFNSDGLTDVLIGGSAYQKAELWEQIPSGKFIHVRIQTLENDSAFEDTDACIFDVDNDGDLDIYMVSGGGEIFRSKSFYSDRLYINEGDYNFTRSLDVPYTGNGSVVVNCDFNKDGNIDIFVGERSIPGKYGIPANAHLLKNLGNGNFEEISYAEMPFLKALGLVKDAIWEDLDNNGWKDLIVVGEWMPIKIFWNNEGVLYENDNNCDLRKAYGWWNVIRSADFDNDGDIDLVAGNLGLNNRLKASNSNPITMVVSDFDGNGSVEQILNYYNNGNSYPFYGKDLLTSQLPHLRKKYFYYDDYKKC